MNDSRPRSTATLVSSRAPAVGLEPVSITVKYFASLRDELGKGEEQLDAAQSCTVADVWARVCGGRELPANVLSAVNLEYVDLDHPVADGDEVAFFPPVTGG